MRGLNRHRSARNLAAGHIFVQNALRRGHYDIVTETPSGHRLCIAFNDLAPGETRPLTEADGLA
jgi:transposase, IS6 family